MALRDQPYIPLYIQDFLTDEKLVECSPASNGVYIRIMCLMHKSKEYGKILLRQNDRREENNVVNLAMKIALHVPWDAKIVETALIELIDYDVLQLSKDGELSQKRMIRDNEISLIRQIARKGGDKQPAEMPTNCEYEYEYETENDIEKTKEQKNVPDEIANRWNAFADSTGLGRVMKLTDKRKSAILSRLKEKEFDFDKILQMISESDFCRGSTGWKVDFDFVFCSQNNYLKILEGKYKNNGKTKPSYKPRAGSVEARLSYDPSSPEAIQSIIDLEATLNERDRTRNQRTGII